MKYVMLLLFLFVCVISFAQINTSGSSVTMTSSAAAPPSVENIYVIDGTLTEPRTVTQNGNSLTFTGNVHVGGSVLPVSDIRKKENLSEINEALEKLIQIETASYNLIDDVEKNRRIGVIAQSVQKQFPEAVTESEGILWVDYNAITPVVLEAMKELYAKIERLEKQ